MKDVIPQRTEEIVIEAAWQVDRASWPGCLVLMISPYPPFGLDFDIVEQIGGYEVSVALPQNLISGEALLGFARSSPLITNASHWDQF